MSDPQHDSPADLRKVLDRVQAELVATRLELSNTNHERRNLFTESDYCTISFLRNLEPRAASNVVQLMGVVSTAENLAERFAPESRRYFTDLWDIYDMIHAAPARKGESGWRELTCLNDPRLDFTTWQKFNDQNWQCTPTSACTQSTPGAQDTFYLCSRHPLIPPRDDVRIEYTAWAEDNPCELSAVIGTHLIEREAGRHILLLEPSARGYCFGFGAFSNTCSVLQRSLRGHEPNQAVRIVPGRKHRCVAERIGGRISLTVDGVLAFEYFDLSPLSDPECGFLSFYSFYPRHHFTDLTIRLRNSSLTADEWRTIDACRRQTLRYTHNGAERYFDSRPMNIAYARTDNPLIHLLIKDVTATVVEHLAAERHRQGSELLRQSNLVLEEKIAERTRELKETLEKLRVSEQRYALAAQGSNDGLWDWNLEKGTVFLSPRWKAILGYADKEVANTLEAWYSLVAPEDLPKLKQVLEAHFAGTTASFEYEYRMRHKDGSARWVHTRGAAIRNQAGAPLRIAGSQTEITARKNDEITLRHDAMHDVLTGLANRALFHLKVAEAFSKRDTRGENFAILFLDLDGFKAINDSLGHLVGDQLLIGIARRLEGVVRPGDIVARMGGDEFTVLLNNVGGKPQVDKVADRVLQAFENPFSIKEQILHVGASVGIAIDRKQFKTPDEIIRKADSAMYHVKMGKRHGG